MKPIARRTALGLAAAALTAPLAACSSTTTTATSAASAGASPSTAGGLTGVSGGTASIRFDEASKTLSGAYLIDGKSVVVDGGSYASTKADQAVFLVVNGGSLTITRAEITKSGDASASSKQNPGDVNDDYNFYGLNSAIVVIGETSAAIVNDCTIKASSSGSNAIFSSLVAQVTVTGTTITTDANSARGLHATYGGKITGADLTITTSGAHSAALATDRGSGTVTVTGTNVLNTSGDGSPLLYSTGAISASGVTGTSADSQVVVIEGKNAATLTDSKVTSKGGDAFMVYQSMSGDAADADAQTSVGSLTVERTALTYTGDGPLLYFTNTTAEAALTELSVTASTASALISAAEDRWGTSGSNGATATVTIAGSTLTGKIAAAGSSKLTVNLTESTTWSGSKSGKVTVTPDSTSKAG